MLRLLQIPMLKDNYSYVLAKDDQAICIDPADPQESLNFFKNNSHLKLLAIFNTHSHQDHVGGNEVLRQKFNCRVYGPLLEQERIPCVTHPVQDNDEVSILGLKLTAHDVKAHTVGHIAYTVHEPIDELIKHGHKREPYEAKDLSQKKVMFVGDSLFAAGCGRLFEGTAQNLLDCLSFYNRQPKDLLMACGHEYTQNNLLFAQSIFPDHRPIRQRIDETNKILEQEGASVPCFFDIEQKTNPFLLALRQPFTSAVFKQLGCKSLHLAQVIGDLRKAKDSF